MPWFTQSPRALDIVPVGRIAVDFNPTDYNRPLSQSEHFNKYLGGSPANIAVGMARLGRRVGFLAKISDDAFGDFVQGFFERGGHRREPRDALHGRGEAGPDLYGDPLPHAQQHPHVPRGRRGPCPAPLRRGRGVHRRHARAAGLGHGAEREPVAGGGAQGARAGAAAGRDGRVRCGLPRLYLEGRRRDRVYTSLVAERSDIILGSREEFDRMERLLGLAGTDEASAAHWLGLGAKLLVIKHGREGLAGVRAGRGVPGAAVSGGGAQGLRRGRRVRVGAAARADGGASACAGAGDGQRVGGDARGQPCVLARHAGRGVAHGLHRGKEARVRRVVFPL